MMLLAPEDISRAVALLRGGGILVYPTETSYAIGCDATNAAAVERIFAMKQREHGKGVPVLLPPTHDPRQYVVWNVAAQSLVERYWPGALNIVAARHEDSSLAMLTATRDTHAIRKSRHEIAAKIAAELDRPIVATSANVVGQTPLYFIDMANEIFQGEQVPDAIIDVGQLPLHPPSTVIKVTRGTYEVLRQGDVVVL